MKEITLEKVLRALEREKPEVEMEDRLERGFPSFSAAHAGIIQMRGGVHWISGLT